MNLSSPKLITEIKLKHESKGIISFCFDNDENILVLDELKHEVFLADKKGEVIWNNNNFKYPTDCCFDGVNFWLSDRYNHRIVSINKNGIIERIIGSYGSSSSFFNEPYGIACFENQSQIAVADSGNNKIKIFSYDGCFLSEIGILGPNVEYYESDFFKKQTVFKKWVSSQSYFNTIESLFFGSRFLLGNLERPKGVSILNNYIVTADFSGKIQMFNKEGILLKSFYKYKYPKWVFEYKGEIYFNLELSSKIYKITKNFNVEEFIDLNIEVGKFHINDYYLTFISPWDNKIFKTQFNKN